MGQTSQNYFSWQKFRMKWVSNYSAYVHRGVGAHADFVHRFVTTNENVAVLKLLLISWSTLLMMVLFGRDCKQNLLKPWTILKITPHLLALRSCQTSLKFYVWGAFFSRSAMFVPFHLTVWHSLWFKHSKIQCVQFIVCDLPLNAPKLVT